MRYRAFLSYSSADRAIGERFQRAIERYRIPKPLRGQDRGFGPVPKYLTPVFRDRSDASASADLGGELSDALRSSDALIPLCSPASARSEWVNTEIRRFKALGRSQRVFPVVVAGKPRRFDPLDAPDAAFPPALFQNVDAQGTVIGEDDATPLAADIRPEGDGFDLARLKIVSALTGVPLTELTQRQLEAERRERRIVRTVAAVMTVLALAAGAAAVTAYVAADAARTRLSRAIEMAARRVDDGATYADAYGVPVEVVRQLLAGAERDFEALIGRDDTRIPVAELQRGRLFLLFSRLHGVVGDSAEQLRSAQRGLATLERVASSRQIRRPETWFTTLPPRGDVMAEQLAGLEALALALSNTGADHAEVMRLLERGRDEAAHAGRRDFVARFWSRIGEQHYQTGDLSKARAAQDAAIGALEAHLAAAPPAERAAALSDRAELLLESERHDEALTAQAEALAVFEAEARARPDDAAALQRLGQALTRHADTRYAVTGTWTDSVPEFTRALELFERLHARDPSRVDFARDLSTTIERLGDVMLQTNDLPRAGSYFERLETMRRRLLSRDPGNVENRRDLAVALERQADFALGQNRPDRALGRLDEARALREPEASGQARAATDLVLTRDLAVLWAKTATARQAARLRTWRDAFEKAIGLMEPIIEAGDAPAGWHRDVAVFRALYGDALAAAGNRGEARAQWTAALGHVDRQLRAQPDDPRLLADRSDLTRRLNGK